MPKSDDTSQEEMESREFREALLNGQSSVAEQLAKLVKVTDNRFRRQSRELRAVRRAQDELLGKIVTAVVTAGGVAASLVVAVIKLWEALW